MSVADVSFSSTDSDRSPQKASFAEVAQKMWWASHRLAALNEDVMDYVNREPYVTFIRDRPEIQSYEVVSRLHEPPSPKLALMAGDFLNNAQGALDYLAWQLVLRENESPGRPTQFPILLPNEDGSMPEPQILNAKRKPAISDEKVLAVLDAVQPYKAGSDARSNWLFVLARLNRETKHRHLPLLAATAPSGSLAAGYKVLPKQIPVFGTKRNKDEEEIQVLPYDDPPNPRMPEKVQLGVQVVIEGVGDPAPLPLVETLIMIHDRLANELLPLFETSFE